MSGHEFTQEQGRYLASACQTLAVANKVVEDGLRDLAKAAHEQSIVLARSGMASESAAEREDVRAAAADSHAAFKTFTKLADVLREARLAAQVEVK